jgi:transcriptional enhancer factor
LCTLHSHSFATDEGIGAMEQHWHTSNNAPYQREPSDLTSGSRVLTSSSGNVQTYHPDSKDGLENQDPLGLAARPEAWAKQLDVQYPIPKVKLGSNDAHTDNLAHLNSRRQSYRPEKYFRRKHDISDRPYLRHPKYLQYRARQRCDTGPDGKPVWDDRTEDAFQNGTTVVSRSLRHC